MVCVAVAFRWLGHLILSLIKAILVKPCVCPVQGEARGLEAEVAAAAAENAEAAAVVAALSARIRERLRYEDAELEVDRKQRQVHTSG